MTRSQFRHKRERIGSMQEVADALGIAKSTLQRYEDGTAKPQPEIAAKLIELERGVSATMKRMPSFISRLAKQQFPHGIVSEVTE